MTGSSDGAGSHLVAVHDHLRSELAGIRSLVQQVDDGVLQLGAARSLLNTMAMRQNNWTLGSFCAAYCRVLTTHHTIEDVSVFPHLRRHQPDLAPVLHRLASEHHVVAELLEAVDAALVGLVGAGGERSSLHAAVDGLDATLTAHLAWEEQMLVGPLDRYGFG